MSNSNKVHGTIKIEPPLNYGEIRMVNEGVKKATRNGYTVLALSQTSHTEDTEEGQFTKITSNMVEVYGEGEYGVVEFLKELAKHGKTHEFIGEITVVDEDAEYIDYNSKDEARRYFIRDGKLIRQVPEIIWGNEEEVK